MSSTWLPFPQRVYNVLKLCEEQGREDIISWDSNGTAFRVNDLEEFKRDLLPRYFNTKKYYTFTRGLYAHGFTCVRAGRKAGIYSHPSFNRNDPLSPSLMKRIPKKKSTSNHADSNPSLEALMNNRHSSPRPVTLDCHPARKLPALVGKQGRDNDGDTATVFGRSYHTIPSQDAAAGVTFNLPPVQIPASPPRTESLGANSRSYTDPTPPTSTSISTWTTNPATSFQVMTNTIANVIDDRHIQGKPISPNDSLFILTSCHMAPIVAPSGRAMNGSEQVRRISMIPCHDFDARNCVKEQDDIMAAQAVMWPPDDNDQQSNNHQPVIQGHTIAKIYGADNDPTHDS